MRYESVASAPTWRWVRKPSRSRGDVSITGVRQPVGNDAWPAMQNVCSNDDMAAQVEYVEITCKSAVNRVQGMPYLKWSLNPYGGCVHRCRFCFAVQYRVVADQGTQQDFGTRLFIKTNFVKVLARELRRDGMQGEHITVGTATDPYQPVEGRYKLTRGALGLLRDHANPVSLLTKSPMIIRDVDLLADLARVASAEVFFSITTVDLHL